MRYRSSSRLSYRNVLIAAGLAAGLGVGSACAEPTESSAAKRHIGGDIAGAPLAGPASGAIPTDRPLEWHGPRR
jgi:hypothetical protein